MTARDTITHRLFNQRIAETTFTRPEEVVAWLGAMQSQEFAMAKWAIALRSKGLTEKEIETAFNEGRILRTHFLRPTWHFVTPADIRWMLRLSAPRVHAVNAYYYRKSGLDNKTFKHSRDVLEKALGDGKHLTRDELKTALERAGIPADGLRLAYLLMHAELEAIICSGPRVGKQFTYALLEERVPPGKTLERDEALAEMSLRYFTSRGPATLQDFVWWSGLNMKDAKEGAAALPPGFVREKIEGAEYIFAPSQTKPLKGLHSTFLLPDYDEYGISYKDRSAFIDPKKLPQKKVEGNFIFSHTIVVDGMMGGSWERTVKGKNTLVEMKPFPSLNQRQNNEVQKAAKRYLAFANAEAKTRNRK